jgi:hypothetical protein
MQAAREYEAFREELLARHNDPVTSFLSTLGDCLLILGTLTAVAGRKFRMGALLGGLGVAAAVVAHLFQPGTLGDELKAISSHPLWTSRAEKERILKS